VLFRLFILAGLLGLAGSSGCGSCHGGGFQPDASVDAPAPGTITLSWSLTDLNGQPIQCDQVGAQTVALQLKNRDKLSSVAESFACQNSPSTSGPIEPGHYDISFELHGINGTLATAASQSNVTIRPGQDTPLAPVTFMVDARGGLALMLAAPGTTSNCAPKTMGGAGITGVSITLVHTGDGCAPVTFTIARGATVLGSYVVNCSAPMVAACIENDETLTVPSMESGPYTIHVVGKNGAIDCWKNDDMLQVPPVSQVLRATLNLASQGLPGC
jgi:hypothetical protein